MPRSRWIRIRRTPIPVPDKTPIDRTKTPVEDEDAVCSFFDTFDEAQDFMALYPEIAEVIDKDGDGIACEDYFLEIERRG